MMPIIDEIRNGGITKFAHIAREINKRGYLTRNDKKWNHSTVKNILKYKTL
jgi:hypothetical protein